jgi:hypothetical protein
VRCRKPEIRFGGEAGGLRCALSTRNEQGATSRREKLRASTTHSTLAPHGFHQINIDWPKGPRGHADTTREQLRIPRSSRRA